MEERELGGAYGLLASLNQVGPIVATCVASRTGHAALGNGDADMYELFLSNFFAQTKALAFGKTAEEVRAEGTAEELVSARVFTGNRPTTSIMAPALTPSVLGQLIALYEHITFVEGAVCGSIPEQLGRSGGRRAEKGFSAEDARAARAKSIQLGRWNERFRRGNGALRTRSESE